MTCTRCGVKGYMARDGFLRPRGASKFSRQGICRGCVDAMTAAELDAANVGPFVIAHSTEAVR